MSSMLGLDLARSWQPPTEGTGDRVASPGAASECLALLGVADRVFQRLGPVAGIDEVASEGGKGVLFVTNLFPTVEDLRLAYKFWTYEDVLDEIRDSSKQMVDGDAETWMEGLRAIWEQFRHYAQNYCQFEGQGAADVALLRKTVDLVTIFIEHGDRVGACAAPDLQLAAMRCSDVLSRPLRRSGLGVGSKLTEDRPTSLVGKGRAALSQGEHLDQRFAEFLDELAPLIRIAKRH